MRAHRIGFSILLLICIQGSITVAEPMPEGNPPNPPLELIPPPKEAPPLPFITSEIHYVESTMPVESLSAQNLQKELKHIQQVKQQAEALLNSLKNKDSKIVLSLWDLKVVYEVLEQLKQYESVWKHVPKETNKIQYADFFESRFYRLLRVDHFSLMIEYARLLGIENYNFLHRSDYYYYIYLDWVGVMEHVLEEEERDPKILLPYIKHGKVIPQDIPGDDLFNEISSPSCETSALSYEYGSFVACEPSTPKEFWESIARGYHVEKKKRVSEALLKKIRKMNFLMPQERKHQLLTAKKGTKAFEALWLFASVGNTFTPDVDTLKYYKEAKLQLSDPHSAAKFVISEKIEGPKKMKREVHEMEIKGNAIILNIVEKEALALIQNFSVPKIAYYPGLYAEMSFRQSLLELSAEKPVYYVGGFQYAVPKEQLVLRLMKLVESYSINRIFTKSED